MKYVTASEQHAHWRQLERMTKAELIGLVLDLEHRCERTESIISALAGADAPRFYATAGITTPDA